ncbi:MAG TPA: hypothetical protein VEL74_15560 [Thermoanaerobaculia bacterium]|nr:hypothetical protein [Thermoanaerobaculia bacterium]
MLRSDTGPILVAGGDRDPNLRALVETLESRGEDVFFLQVGADHNPWIAWDLASDRLTVDGEEVRPRAAFLRHDVFTNLADGRRESAYRAAAWHTAVYGWVLAHEDVRMLNRWNRFPAANKPHALHLARQCGLAIPTTLITNHLGRLDAFEADRAKIVKPINGGAHTQRLHEVVGNTQNRGGVAAAPAIVQTELVPPEVRVFRVGDSFLAFKVLSEELDYRSTQQTRVEPIPVPAGLAQGLGMLTDALGMDFGAADFKTCAETGRPLFLEINTSPMFAAFNAAGRGAVTGAMADYLTGRPALRVTVAA